MFLVLSSTLTLRVLLSFVLFNLVILFYSSASDWNKRTEWNFKLMRQWHVDDIVFHDSSMIQHNLLAGTRCCLRGDVTLERPV